MAGVSVRTLHHYDALGLLVPSERSDSGYRLYSESDLAVLQQLMFFKELGLSLDAIGRIMHDPSFDRREALLLQKRMLEARLQQLEKMIDAVKRAIHSIEKGTSMNETEMFEVFGEFDPRDYEQEAQERWGGTAAYDESARRTATYDKRDWQVIQAESADLNGRLAELLDAGVAPDDPRAMDLAEEHRLVICRRYYPCSYQMHEGLGEMFVVDPRFARNYEELRPGLAQYVCDAIKANAARSRPAPG